MPRPGHLPVRVRRELLWAAAVAAAVYFAAFRLPYWWPPERRLVSASYTFGFNNLVAIVAVAGLLAALAVLLAARSPRAGAPRLPLQFDAGDGGDGGDAGRRSGPRVLGAVLLLYAALTAAMYAYTMRQQPFLTWETRHFLHRVLLMDVYGLRPYTDFQAEYGPALTVTPLYLYRLLRPFGTTHTQAYFVCHLLFNAAGVACLYYLLWRVEMPARRRVLAFVVLALAGFVPYMGLNGVVFRYVCPFASLLLGHRAVTRLTRPPASAARWAVAGAVVLALLGANILISPEIALAFALAWLAYAALLVRQDWRLLAMSLAALAAAALLSRATLPPAYYGSLLRFSEGANNLPLLPAPFLLLYLATLFLAVPALLATGLRTLVRGDVPDARAAALCGALGGLCVVLAPGALGRADPPHVLFYSLGASMLLMMMLANGGRLRFAVYAGAYAAVHVALAPVVLLVQYYGASPRLLLSRAAPGHVLDKVRSAKSTPPDTARLAVLERYRGLGLPYATYADPAVERYVIEHRLLAPEYYIATVGVYTEAALKVKLRDVARYDYLLVQQGYEVRWSRDRCAQYLVELRRSLLYPARLTCRKAALDVDGIVNDYIVDHYVPVERIAHWVVLRRAGTASAPDARP
jgi:hypothetical protein